MRVVAAVLAVDEVADHAGFERAGTEQGYQRDDVFEPVRLQAPDEVFHAAGFELEHRGGFRLRHQVVGRLVIHRQGRDVEQRLTARRAARIDDLHRPVDDGERAQSQEVELDETRGLDVVLVELRDDAAALVIGVQRRELGELRRRDDHATGMHAGVAGEPFERHARDR